MVMRFKQWLEAFNVQGLMDTPEKASKYAKEIGQRVPELEPLILTDPDSAYRYAKDGVGGRWPEGEAVIATDPGSASRYAQDVVRGRWSEAEEALLKARDPWAASWYAKNIIGGRWPEAEGVIVRDPQVAYRYAQDVLKPWLKENPGAEIPKGFERWL